MWLGMAFLAKDIYIHKKSVKVEEREKKKEKRKNKNTETNGYMLNSQACSDQM